jgi:membrane protease YdiL (CAAX protease family)
VPLLVLAQIAVRALPLAGIDDFGALPLGARIAVSIGAGLYEELVFRLLLIWLLLTVLVDFVKFSRRVAVPIAVGLSALAFTVYHPLHDADGTFIAQRFAFYLVAGVYFGVLLLMRGFGIVVATHALYDIATALLASRAADAA